MGTKRLDSAKNTASSPSARAGSQPAVSGYQSASTSSTLAAAKPKAHKTIRLSHDQIAARAKAIWLKNGCPCGQDEKNWLQAEAELRAEQSG